MSGATEIAKELKNASIPAILIFGGISGAGLEVWPEAAKAAASWTGFVAWVVGILWAIGIGIGRVTRWRWLRRLDES